VGTTHTQLNRGFGKLYGTSVVGCLRKMRLEKARHFLKNGDMNVTEAAIAVGYNSLSSFSRAFSSHFGLKPVSY
jgi:AraC-like DNA-binding protein